jgi:uroporphyrinogen-III synthase
VRLLLTRPEPDAQRTAAALRGRGHTVVIAPLMRIEPVADAAIDGGPWEAILVTSANAARAIAAHERLGSLLDVPVLAVGDRSAQAMRAAGFTEVTSADGGVDDLAHLAATQMKPSAALLYLAGEERSGDLAGDLRGRGFAVDTVVVYRAVAEAILPPMVVNALASGVDGVLHFSRRSAEAYANAARAAGVLPSALRPAQFCLSGQIAEPLARAGAATIHVAPRPMEAALIELIGSNPA